ncbi:MAG: hypothetical protein NTW86_23950, partial [Candidatus Sumerlaeota bacterium]|nr:hypothetical protein [Candidatus Sumerlaeota bacterium]
VVNQDAPSSWTLSAKLHFDDIDLERAAAVYAIPGARLRGTAQGDLALTIVGGRLQSLLLSASNAGGPVWLDPPGVRLLASLDPTGASTAIAEEGLRAAANPTDPIPFASATVEGFYVPPDPLQVVAGDEFRLTAHLKSQAFDLTPPISLDRAKAADYLAFQQEKALLRRQLER